MEPSAAASADLRRSWRRFFQRAAVWIAIGLVLLATLRFESLTDRDIRTVVSYAVMIITLVAVVIAWLRWVPLSLAKRLLAVGAVAAVLFALNRALDPINDGDARIVGWRWAWNAKPDQALARLKVAKPQAAETWQPTPQDFPRFLGTGYWAEVKDVALAPDWRTKPPELVWKRPIGAGWSAFAIVGQHAVTQEQRGPNEHVTCYSLSTGEPEWTHADETRFDPDHMGAGLGGVGPRATPTIHNGRVFTQGALGRLNCLDAQTGKPVWSVDAAEEFKCAPLFWGNSMSPLVLDELGVVVFAIGNPIEEENCAGSLVALELESGKLRWQACEHTSSYASPIVATLAGQPTLLMVNENFLSALNPDDGKKLWEHPWPGLSDSNATCSQPVPLGGDQVLLTKGYGVGSTLLGISYGEGKWQTTPEWSPAVRPGLKTKFGNVLIRDGYGYGLADVYLECVELATGKSMWKKRRPQEFGHGQMLLVGEVMLILSETGELVAVRCAPKKYEELGALQAITAEGVSWNNLALSGDLLLLRNDQEAACYRLPLQK